MPQILFLYLLLLLSLSHGSSHLKPYEIDDPHFKPPNGPNVSIEPGPVGQIYQYDVIVDENYVGTILTLIDSVKPTVSFRKENDGVSLGYEVQEGDAGIFNMIITKEQDYETSPVDNSVFNVKFSDVEISFNFRTKNIDDETPIVTVNQNTCSIQENTLEPNLNCTYKIKDRDGKSFFENFTYDNPLKDIFDFEPIGTTADEMTLLLVPKVQLDYEVQQIHTMTLTVTDTGGHNASADIVVKVLDVNDKPPTWSNINPFQQINESEPQTFIVTAIDGDYSINSEINYRIDNVPSEVNIIINESSGEITISSIDRDEKDFNNFQFDVIAFEKEAPDFEKKQTISVIVTDINDNRPEITTSTQHLEIKENGAGTLPLKITINDKDLGENAFYEVSLTSSDKFHEAFQIVPDKGYKNLDFSLLIKDSSKLNYEDETWRTFSLQIIAVETKDNNHQDSVEITIALTDENDEIPIFKPNIEEVNIEETVPKGTVIGNLTATDADLEDVVLIHTIPGDMNNELFEINAETGEVKTKVDNVFDYERQPLVYIPIEATDKVGHKVSGQIKVNVIDVNDEKPILSINPVIQVAVDENTVGSINLDPKKITARDNDKGANLDFSINWDDTIFKKDGTDVLNPLCKTAKCLKPITKVNGNGNNVYLDLEIIEGDASINAFDFETFDTIFLYVKVTDTLQEIEPKSDIGILEVKVIDVNDNSPILDKPPAIKVMENSREGVKIATIGYTDEDTVGTIKFTLVSNDDLSNLVTINESTGELFTTSNIIDAEVYNKLTYDITVSDGIQEDTKTYEIVVEDENDNEPIFEKIEDQFIPEHSEGVVLTLKANDADRDEPFNTVTFDITPGSANAENIRECYIISSTGTIEVKDKSLLDREDSICSNLRLSITAKDGAPENPKSSFVEFSIILTDINDNVPAVQKNNFEVSENAALEEVFGTVTATDKDDPKTDNAKISLSIFDVASENGNTEVKNFFVLTQTTYEGTAHAELSTGANLTNQYGRYTVTIQADDHGEEPLSAKGSIIVDVQKYNFEAPKFVFPRNEEKIYLNKKQQANQVLVLYNNGNLQHFEADDNQIGKWNMTMEITNEEPEVQNLFTIVKVPNFANKFMLQVKEDLTETQTEGKTYTLQLKVSNDGIPQLQGEAITVTILFINLDEEPIFNIRDPFEIEWNENSAPLSVVVREASFPIEDIPEGIYIYYFLKESNDEMFSLDKNSNKLTLLTPLDAESTSEVNLTIVASNSASGNLNPSEESTLDVIIKVGNINDNSPTFKETLYVGGIIYQTTKLGQLVKQVEADDLDFSDLAYSLENFQAEGSGISGVKDPFTIDSELGEIKLNFDIQSNMNGYFTFTVKANDGVHSATTNVRIYIVTEDNRVEVTFQNTVDELVARKMEIAQIFSINLGYLCNIETITPDTDDSGSAVSNKAMMRSHFIDQTANKPVAKDTIYNILSDIKNFEKLRSDLLKETLSLYQVKNDVTVVSNTAEVLQAWLIGVSVVLGLLCAVLIVAFILKTRSLTQRLNKLSTTKFGSDESLANRNPNMPNSNRHMVEGSNPIYNEDKKMPDLDTKSISSGDSDLIGVEDNPEFDYAPGDTRGNQVRY